MNIVITGITGFAGSHLAEHLIRKGHRIRGLGAPQDSLSNLDALISNGKIKSSDIVLADLEDQNALERLLDPNPDYVYHLAAQASVPRSWDNPRETFRINLMGTLNLLECLKELNPCPKMLYVSSADVYGASAKSCCSTNPSEPPLLLTEDIPLQPMNPYSLSKAAADNLCYQLSQQGDLPIIRVRAFNHIGPRQSKGFAAADFASQIAMGEIDPDRRIIRVGRLDAIRDFTDVRDMVRAYELSITKGEPGAVYNICTGQGHTLQELLDGLLSQSSTDFEIVQDQTLLRPIEIPCFVGSNKLFFKTTGWSPEILWSQTLEDILEDHRRHLPV